MENTSSSPISSPTPNTPVTRSSSSKVILVSILIVVIIAMAAGMFMLYQSKNKILSENDALKANLEQETALLPIPAGAVKTAECIPQQGEHWAMPANIPFGPFYIGYKGKIVGIEYMIPPEKIPGKDREGWTQKDILAYMAKNNKTFAQTINENLLTLDLLDQRFDHMFMHQGNPHAGMPYVHYDMHFYLISKEEVKAMCPDQTIQQTSSPEVLNNLKEYNLFIPGQPTSTPSGQPTSIPSSAAGQLSPTSKPQ